jgi:DNA-binding beta-propeller fold protein YncE
MIINCRHASRFGKPFVAGLLLTLVGPSVSVGQSSQSALVFDTSPIATLGPTDVVVSHDGSTLYVANADAKQIVVVDTDEGKVLESIAMPAEPTGLVLGPGGAKLYITCAAPEGTVQVIDLKSGSVDGSITVGHWPIGPAISPDGKVLYVCNRFDKNVAVVEVATERITFVPATREPYAAAVTPDGKSVFVINHLPLARADSFEIASVVSVIDTATDRTQSIRLPVGSTCMRGICVSPDGAYVYATHLLSRYQMPTTQVKRGWMNTNALSIIDARRKKLVNTVLLDDLELGAGMAAQLSRNLPASRVKNNNPNSTIRRGRRQKAAIERVSDWPPKRA